MSKESNLTLCDYLEHILQASERIERYLVDVDFTGFMANEEKQDAVIRNIAGANLRRPTWMSEILAMQEQIPANCAAKPCGLNYRL